MTHVHFIHEDKIILRDVDTGVIPPVDSIVYIDNKEYKVYRMDYIYYTIVDSFSLSVGTKLVVEVYLS